MSSPIRRFLLATLTLVEMLTAAPALAQSVEGSGLPIPRFVSLRSEQVRMRTGPADTHPVAWVYTKRDLPVEITAEYKHWRRIRDWQGSEGWVHQSLLSGRRTIMVVGERRLLRSEPRDQAAAVAYLDVGVVAKVVKCPHGNVYCRVETGGYNGWLKREELWGIYSGEYID
jgi:SH3-like domain-containing protein